MNLFQTIRRLGARPAAQIGEVLSIHTDNTSTVQYVDGSQQRVRGTIVAVGQPAYVRDGAIEGLAPARTVIDVEI